MRMFKAAFAMATAFVLGIALEALSMEALTEEELLFMEVPVVITASRFEQYATKAPSTISIVTSEDIKRHGYRTLADIMRSVRGFYVTDDRNYNYLGMRGFNRPGDYGTKILLFINGLRANISVFDSIAVGTDFVLDADLIDRVEVVRGPGSSLYGSNAFFAVINVITKKGAAINGTEVSLEAGDLGARKARLSFGKRFGQGLETLLSGSYYDSSGYDRLYYGEFDDPLTNNGFSENNDYDRYRSIYGSTSFKGFTLQYAYSYRKKGVPTASFETTFNDAAFFTVDKNFFIDAKYDKRLAGDANLTARVNYNYNYYYGEYPYELVATDMARGKWYGAEIMVSRDFAHHKAIGGAEYRNNYELVQKFHDGEGIYLNEKNSYESWGVYAQDEFNIMSRLTLNAGVRYDHYSTFGGAVSPRVGLICNLTEKSVLKLIYGTAFRAPSDYELNYHDMHSQKSNPGLKPEKIKTYELVYEQYMDDNLYFTASVFSYWITGLIDLAVDESDGLLIFRNINEARSNGADVEVEKKWESGAAVKASYSYQVTEDKRTGEMLSNSLRHIAKFNTVLPFFNKKLSLGLEEQFLSKRRTLAGNYVKEVFLTNLTLFNKTLLKGLELSASIYNVFDHKFSDPASNEHIQDEIEQDGRRLRIKAVYNF